MTVTVAMAGKRDRLLLAVGLLVLSVPAPARADAAQAGRAIQAAYDRATAYYRHRDLNGYMVMFAPTYRGRNVIGQSYDYRETLAGVAADFAAHRTITAARASSRVVSLHGASADVLVDWHFASRSVGYVHSRDYTERAVWVRGHGGWREVGAWMMRDDSRFQHNSPPPVIRSRRVPPET